jgi:soluble lytic murein transglycosylase-like protein
MRACVLVAVVTSIPALAGEYAILASGQRIRADRHEQSGTTVRLFHREGVTELPAASIFGFEQDDYIPPPPVVAEPPKVAKPSAPVPRDPKELVRDAAARSGLPPAFVESVAQVESAFRTGAISPKGAIGVMQLMPQTAKQLGSDPHNLEENIDAGARLLRELLLKYNGDVVKALAAYNAGAGAVDRFGGLPPYQETRYYVNKVIGAYRQAGGK